MGFWSKVKGFFRKVGNGAKKVIGTVGSAVKKGVGWVYNTGKKIINGALDLAGGVVRKVSDIGHTALELGGHAVDIAGQALGHVGGFVGNLAPVVGAVAPAITGALTGGVGAIGSVLGSAGSAVSNFAGSGVANLVRGFGNFAGNLFRGNNNNYSSREVRAAQSEEVLQQQQAVTGTQPAVLQSAPITPVDEVSSPGLLRRAWNATGGAALGLISSHPYMSLAAAGAGLAWNQRDNIKYYGKALWNKARSVFGYSDTPPQEEVMDSVESPNRYYNNYN